MIKCTLFSLIGNINSINSSIKGIGTKYFNDLTKCGLYTSTALPYNYLWNYYFPFAEDDNLATLMAALSNIWGIFTTAERLVKRGVEHGWVHLILVHHLLYGYAMDDDNNLITLPDDYYECMLDAGPCRGYDGVDFNGNNAEWSAASRLDNGDRNFNDAGMENGVQYMFLFNLYNYLHPFYLIGGYHPIAIEQLALTDVIKENYTENERKNFMASNEIIAQNYTIDNDPVEGIGNVTFLAGNQIRLKEGFRVKMGANFRANTNSSIQSMSCQEPSWTDCSHLLPALRMANSSDSGRTFQSSDVPHGNQAVDSEIRLNVDSPIRQFNINVADNGKMINDPSISLPHSPIVMIYPNPIVNHLHVDIFLNEPVHLKIEFYNPLGKRIDVMRDQKVSNGQRNFLLDCTVLPQGVYFIKVLAGEDIFTKKIVKMK
ncbi:MAG: T9SS type A sorting domain-containing protein [Bacteroidetes bacterium]|nr:T9SS type A sorting domain-containing protein [Bacteroidota bacterium]